MGTLCGLPVIRNEVQFAAASAEHRTTLPERAREITGIAGPDTVVAKLNEQLAKRINQGLVRVE